MDNALPTGTNNNKQTDDTQNKVDIAPASPPPAPPPLVEPEKPEEIKGPNQVKKIGKKIKKNGLKIAGGLMMFLLVAGGLFVGRNIVQERQVIEKEAYDPGARRRCSDISDIDDCGNFCHIVDGYGCKKINGECKAFLEPACKKTRDNSCTDEDYTNNTCCNSFSSGKCDGISEGKRGDCPSGQVCKAYDHKYGNPTCSCASGIPPGMDCGSKPDPLPEFEETGSIGPFPRTGKLVVYLYGENGLGDGKSGYASGVEKLRFDYNGEVTDVELNGSSKEKVVTDIVVQQGDSIIITDTFEHDQKAGCAPDHSLPHQGIGWMPINSDNTCGTGLPGPPQGGVQTPFDTPSILAGIEWAESLGNELLAKQCWADWREWPGDYDFEDYFLMFSYEPADGPDNPYCEDLTYSGNEDFGEELSFTCVGSGDYYRFRYMINGGSPILINQDNVNGNTTSINLNEYGDWLVQCKVCNSSNVCTVWGEANEIAN
ncbi:MAG: hypothetical protein U9Q63_03170 [Patescibacteria group bacterium]|nr:hypothetical protein [Patescibacteria group bacterium]